MAGYFQPLANIPAMGATNVLSSRSFGQELLTNPFTGQPIGYKRWDTADKSIPLGGKMDLFGGGSIEDYWKKQYLAQQPKYEAEALSNQMALQRQQAEASVFNPTQYAEDLRKQQEYERSKLALGQQKMALGQQMLGNLSGFFSNFGKNFGQTSGGRGLGQMPQAQQTSPSAGALAMRGGIGGGNVPSFPFRQSPTTNYWTNSSKPSFPFSSMGQPMNRSLFGR